MKHGEHEIKVILNYSKAKVVWIYNFCSESQQIK